ncbi:MAG: hypothetical protein M3510_12415 [Actinomycetota bacterium]|nr:hypothetical protein [Actinomycetota bacterium]
MATTPHRGQPVTDSVVSTSSSTSPAYSPAANTTNSGRPSATEPVSIRSPTAGMPVRSCIIWGLSFRVFVDYGV